MSCNQLNAILLGGQKGVDGVYALHRDILFSPAGKWITDALPQSAHIVHAREQSEPELEGIQAVSCPDGADFASMVLTAMEGMEGNILLLSAPMPTVSKEEYQKMIDQHTNSTARVTKMVCAAADDTWQAAIFDAGVLRETLAMRPHTLTQTVLVAGERTDLVSIYRTGTRIVVHSASDAYRAQKILQERINFAWMDNGVSMFDPACTYISPDAEIGAGTTLLPGCMIHPGSKIGCGCTIGPNTILDRAVIGDRTSVNSSQIYESSVGSDATVGPFAYIRPGCTVGDDTRIGDFVELKKASIGNSTKVSHLTYIGDATVGERVNFGCGTVVVNYDGYEKNRTIIGDDCFIGCNTNLVAPLEVGDRVLTAAGTTVTKNVPEGALAVARVRQENKEGWNDRRRRMHGQK